MHKNEKSFDNCSAARVSREPRAPRAGQDRKPCMVNGLRLVSRLTIARGAHVSRAARGLERASHAMRLTGTGRDYATLTLQRSEERRPPVCDEVARDTNVTPCHWMSRNVTRVTSPEIVVR